MGASNGGIGGVYGGGGIQPQPPSGDGTRGFDVMPRQTPIALGNFGPKSGPANNPGGGWGGGVAAPTPIARPNPIGGNIPGYTPPPGWGDLPTDGGGERPMAPPNGPGTGGGAPNPNDPGAGWMRPYPYPSPVPTPAAPPTWDPNGSVGWGNGRPLPPISQPEPIRSGPGHVVTPGPTDINNPTGVPVPGGGWGSNPSGPGPGASPGIPQPVSPIAGPGHAPGGGGVGIPQPMPPTTGPGVGPINDPGDPPPPGTGGSSGGNGTGPRPSLRPMPQPKMPRRTDVSFYRPPQTLQPQPAKDPTGGGLDPRRGAPIYVRPKFQ